jgi:cell division protein FtsA
MANIITAIDIGSHKITAVVTAVDEKGKVKVIGESSYPSYGIRKGEITGIEEAMTSIASALNGAERMAGVTVSSAYVSINGRNIVSNNSKGVVAVSEEIMEDDVIRALEQAKTVSLSSSREIIHLIRREFIVDQQTGIKNPVGMTGSRLEVDCHIISAPTTAIHNIERCIQTIGLRIDAIVFSGWASSYATLTPTEKELGVILLDIGGGTTTITSFVEDAVTYSGCVPLGGSNITRDLTAGLRVFSMDDAEKIKISLSDMLKKNPGKAKEESDIIDISDLNIEGAKTISKKQFNSYIEPRVEEIFEYVVNQMSQAGFDYQLPAGIVLTGGTSSLPGITSIASKVFGVPARVAAPRGLEGLVEGISSPAYSTIQGLVLHAMQNDLYVSSGSSKYSSGSGMKSKFGSGSGMGAKIGGFLKRLLP